MAALANSLWLAWIVSPIGYAWFEARRLADGTVPGWWPWAWPSIPQMVAADAAMFVAQRLAHAVAER